LEALDEELSTIGAELRDTRNELSLMKKYSSKAEIEALVFGPNQADDLAAYILCHIARVKEG